MRWDDFGILLSVKKLGENSGIVTAITQQRGVHCGVIRLSAKNRSDLQLGNLLQLSWQARLEEHLGNFKAELKAALPYSIISDRLKLSALSSIASIMVTALSERVCESEIYNGFNDLLDNMSNSELWLKQYLLLEELILEKIGYGMDLRACVVTGVTEDLCYVSPKSGCAVSRQAGTPYHDKLFLLPHFFLNDKSNPSEDDLYQGLKITSFFLTKYFLEHSNKQHPSAKKEFNSLCTKFLKRDDL